MVRRALAENAATAACKLLGDPNMALSSKAELRFRRKGSLAVVIQGAKKGLYFDHEAGLGGDMINLIERQLGIGLREALVVGERLLGGAVVSNLAAPPVRQSGADFKNCEHTDTRSGLHLWREAIDLRGSLGERYLLSRGITSLPRDVGEALRFHPAGPFGAKRSPMLIALYRDILSNEPRAVHRTALSVRGEKIGRMCLGPKAGAAIKLAADADVAQGLTVGEGIETTLSAMMLGLTPAWALGDAGSIGSFPVLAGIDGLTILVDHDASGTGQKQAAKCRDRWLAARREVLTVQPNQVGHDVNDLLGARR